MSSRDIVLGGGATITTGGAPGSGGPIIVVPPGTEPPAFPASVSGLAQDGQTLTAVAPASLQIALYQWQELIGGAWVDLAGATTSTYAVQSADIGRQIRVEMTSTDNLTAASNATNAVLNAAGDQYVYETADQTTIGGGRFQYVYGSATNTTLIGGGTQTVYSDGAVMGTTLWTSGTQIDWGVVSQTYIQGGTQYVWGFASQTVITSGTQYVGGTSSLTTIAASGKQIIYSGGTATVTTIVGHQQVYGDAEQTTINRNGLQSVYGSAAGTTVNIGGEQNVYAGGSASGTTVNAGGVQVVWGTASDTAIDAGRQYVWGNATNTIINDGGEQDVEIGASARGTTLSGGTLFFDGAVQSVWGSATDTVLGAGAAQYVEYGGSADNTTISTDQQAPSSGQAMAVVAKQFVYGTATGTVINNGGMQEVSAYGTATGTTINAGGSQVVYGDAFQATIDGGSQYVWGTVHNTNIVSGSQLVEAGGISDTTTLGAGASEIVLVGGLARNIVFNGAATVFMALSFELQGTVSGWQAGDSIAFNDIAFKSSTTLAYAANGSTGGTLTVANDSQSATLSLLGQYTAADFAIASDGHGGTSIYDPVTPPTLTITPPHAA